MDDESEIDDRKFYALIEPQNVSPLAVFVIPNVWVLGLIVGPLSPITASLMKGLQIASALPASRPALFVFLTRRPIIILRFAHLLLLKGVGAGGLLTATRRLEIIV